MARARNIKAKFFSNSDLVELPFETRLLFIGLWCLADRAGRLEDRPKQIRMELFPADNVDVDKCLAALDKSAFVIRYEADGKRLIQVANFAKHQRPHYKEPALYPPPPGFIEPQPAPEGEEPPSKQSSDDPERAHARAQAKKIKQERLDREKNGK